MGKMKVRHFLEQGMLIEALLSGLIELARIANDSWKEFLHFVSWPTKVGRGSDPTLVERKEWEPLITTIKVLEK
jgi:hypothetical protein